MERETGQEKRQRNKFKVGDRVKTWFHGKWWSGEVVEIGLKPVKQRRFLFDVIWRRGRDPGVEILREDEEYVTFLYPSPENAWMYIRTDEKIDDELDALFEGFGLQCSTRNRLTILEDEPEPDTSDPIFRNS